MTIWVGGGGEGRFAFAGAKITGHCKALRRRKQNTRGYNRTAKRIVRSGELSLPVSTRWIETPSIRITKSYTRVARDCDSISPELARHPRYNALSRHIVAGSRFVADNGGCVRRRVSPDFFYRVPVFEREILLYFVTLCVNATHASLRFEANRATYDIFVVNTFAGLHRVRVSIPKILISGMRKKNREFYL